jgi:hypothetical protein
MSFLEKLRSAQAEIDQTPQTSDPWRLRLERVRGTTGFDGLERISTQTLLDILEVPQHQRTAGTYRRLATLMAEFGWTAVRVRDLTRGGYKEQVRGYVRTAKRS